MSNFQKRLIVFLMLLALSVSSIAAFRLTGKSEIEVVKKDVDTEQPYIVLTTVSMFGGTDSNADNYRAINEKFMEENPYVTIEDNSQTADQDWKEKMAVDFAVGNEPDVIQYFTDANANDVLATDKFVTIDEIREEYPEYAQYTLPEALAAAANPDGTQRAVPTIGFFEGLFCNKDLFDQYNLNLPYTWDDLLIATLKKIMRKKLL